MIEVQNLTVTLPSRAGDVNILRGLNVTIAPGEAVGLIGPSGSGKTTLLMVLAGLEPATSGAVHIAGHDYANMSEDDLARFRRSHVGIVFQSFHLVPTMTALENVMLPLELASQAEAPARAAKILAEVGLADRHDHYPTQMSGGEQQRVALARALVANPPVLFADEPTGNLDQKTGQAVMDLILGLAKERGTTLVLITHDKNLAQRCDRTLTMRDGRLEAESGA
ncbi:MAG: ABC transporter ATP-binding protein [Rhodobiaceae bacterium]|jgi:putative ABC transport system ATP-binding protein|nr:ABC transporter ATP-binding protein [Rhodobiaceae bacterium]MBT5518671.1 ABC transporter ATP-binding protein [Rhodobiaceae bacterium]MBT7279111.1 ABC transporter ATP-binding protein [Rhodobiaceae bacterium]MDG2495789.1 ABC transporter ATP-binding protein [Alphaproteobacteria bacterium]